MLEYLLTLAILAAINVVLAASFNVVLGYGGLASIAHPIFYAIGAYASALLARDLGWPVPVAVLCGMVAAGGSLGRALGSGAPGIGGLPRYREHRLSARDPARDRKHRGNGGNGRTQQHPAER